MQRAVRAGLTAVKSPATILAAQRRTEEVIGSAPLPAGVRAWSASSSAVSGGADMTARIGRGRMSEATYFGAPHNLVVRPPPQIGRGPATVRQ